MHIYLQKIKFLLAPLLVASIAWGAVQLNSVVYDLEIGIDETYSVVDFNPQGGTTYYKPLIFNDGPTIGFGGGQLDTFEGFERHSKPFNGTITLAEDTTYAAVFSSFSPDALGTMQVRLTAPGQIYIADFVTPIPELKDTGLWIALIVGFFVAFSYLKIKNNI